MDNSETTTTTAPVAAPAAPEATQTTAPVAAPTPAAAPVSAPVAAPAPAAPPVEAPAPATEPAKTEEVAEDYSWVPKKFVIDGKPDMKKLSESYQALEKKIHSKAGVAPESLDEYVYEPKHYASSPEETTAFKEVAQKLSLSPSQYAGLQEFYDEYASRTMYTPEKAQAYLEERWGNDMKRNSQAAIRAWDTFGPSGVSIDAVGNIPEFIEFMAAVGADLGEDNTPSKSSAGASARMSRDDVRELMIKKESLPPNSKERQEMDATIEQWYAKNIK